MSFPATSKQTRKSKLKIQQYFTKFGVQLRRIGFQSTRKKAVRFFYYTRQQPTKLDLSFSRPPPRSLRNPTTQGTHPDRDRDRDIGVASYGALGHDFQLVDFWRSLTSQTLSDDSRGFLSSRAFSGHRFYGSADCRWIVPMLCHRFLRIVC